MAFGRADDAVAAAADGQRALATAELAARRRGQGQGRDPLGRAARRAAELRGHGRPSGSADHGRRPWRAGPRLRNNAGAARRCRAHRPRSAPAQGHARADPPLPARHRRPAARVPAAEVPPSHQPADRRMADPRARRGAGGAPYARGRWCPADHAHGTGRDGQDAGWRSRLRPSSPMRSPAAPSSSRSRRSASPRTSSPRSRRRSA